jgi:tripartite-type tricarboxylate transporter receptor subunit TctC
MRGREFIRLFAGVLATWSLIAHAQNSPADYPDRPITLVVPYAPGGGNDVLARAVAEHMSKSLGQALVTQPCDNAVAERAGARPHGAAIWL